MFQKAKNFMMRKLLEKQLKNAPKEQKEMIMALMEKNPELLEKIAKEMQLEMKAGKSQMAAAMAVMPKYQSELREAMGDMVPQGGAAGRNVNFNPNGTIHK